MLNELFFELVTAMAWKGGLILAIGLGALWLARQASARVRANWLVLVLAASIVVPAAMVGLERAFPGTGLELQLPIPTKVGPGMIAATGQTSPGHDTSEMAWPVGKPGFSTQMPKGVATNDSVFGLNRQTGTLTGWIVVCWLVGGLLVLVRHLVGRLVVERRLRCLSRLKNDEIRGVIEASARRQGLGLPDCLLVEPAGRIPWVCRSLRWGNCLVLPAEACRWPHVELEMALAHELGHLGRHDPACRIAVLWLCAVQWFNPLAWVVRAHVHGLQEEACDQLVLGDGHRPAEYATLLLALVARPTRREPTAALSMARPRGVGQRIRQVLAWPGQGNRRGMGGIAALAGAGILVIGLVIPAGAQTNRVEAAAQTTEATPAALNTVTINTVALPLIAEQVATALEARDYDPVEASLGAVRAIGSSDRIETAGSLGNATGMLIPPLPRILPFVASTKNLAVSLAFGPTINPFTQLPMVHLGVDIAGAVGVRVIAPIDGTVVETGSRNKAEGNYLNLLVDQPIGASGQKRILLRFTHLQEKPTLGQGERIKAGQLIGRLGNTGKSTGAHLHYEVLVLDGDRPVLALDPLGLARSGLPTSIVLP